MWDKAIMWGLKYFMNKCCLLYNDEKYFKHVIDMEVKSQIIDMGKKIYNKLYYKLIWDVILLYLRHWKPKRVNNIVVLLS